MKNKKQVNKSHYSFGHYMSKERWHSVWHQVDEIQKLRPGKILEIGPGPGLLKAIAQTIGLNVETLDLDSELNPDHLGSATNMPFTDGEYDIVCAFQVLEHLPYDQSLQAFREMARVAGRGIIISLPDAKQSWPVSIYIPKFGSLRFLVPRPRLRSLVHKFDGEHYWEVNKRGYPLGKIANDFSAPGWALKETYRVHHNPYHRFFVFVKRA